MQKEILHDLIERYLDDDVSEAEQQTVDRLLATDTEFRKALEFQRAMQLHLGDPGELRLHAALDDILLAPPTEIPKPPAKPKSSGWLRFGGLLLLLLLVGIPVWYFGDNRPIPTEPVPAQQPIQKSPTEPIEQTTPAPIKNPSKDLPKRQIARANPKSFFKPNSVFEDRINANVRGDGGVEISLSSPAIGAVFHPENGKIALPITGILSADSLALLQPIRLLIYSNRPEKKQALFNLSLPFEPAGVEQYRMDFIQLLSLRPGLYYVVAGQERPAEAGGGYRTLWVGKFTVKD
ncbi:MAG: hypothetical protein H7246_08205 [Phycisphaerae bacterium]|nr:hypothetical protein [Saprospiraceae bacterium]